MDRLGVGAAFAISGLIIFVSSGSVGDKVLSTRQLMRFWLIVIPSRWWRGLDSV
jgi:hypothetical protein